MYSFQKSACQAQAHALYTDSHREASGYPNLAFMEVYFCIHACTCAQIAYTRTV